MPRVRPRGPDPGWLVGVWSSPPSYLGSGSCGSTRSTKPQPSWGHLCVTAWMCQVAPSSAGARGVRRRPRNATPGRASECRRGCVSRPCRGRRGRGDGAARVAPAGSFMPQTKRHPWLPCRSPSGREGVESAKPVKAPTATAWRSPKEPACCARSRCDRCCRARSWHEMRSALCEGLHGSTHSPRHSSFSSRRLQAFGWPGPVP